MVFYVGLKLGYSTSGVLRRIFRPERHREREKK
jgi:hypothetical protein